MNRALFLFLALTGCATAATTSDTLAPRMFDAEGLRAGIPQGTVIRYRFEISGSPTIQERWEFTTTTATITVIESERFAEDGTSLGAKERNTHTWVELEGHGSFPKENTTIEDVELDSALGKKKCRLYTVAAVDEKKEPITRTFHFAYDLPGPPLRFETIKNGERVFLGEMLERTSP